MNKTRCKWTRVNNNIYYGKSVAVCRMKKKGKHKRNVMHIHTIVPPGYYGVILYKIKRRKIK